MSMQDLFQVGDSGAQRIIDWGKAMGLALLVALGLWASLDVSDALSSSTPKFAAQEWWRHAFGESSVGEREARALLAQAAREADLPGLLNVRVWASDKIAGAGSDGMFNPLVYKITLGERFAESADYDQRWLVFHEAGHAAQMLTSRYEPLALPSWGLSAKASAAMAGSLLYRQTYAESFADVFALAMALRLDPQDPRAISELGRARRGVADSVSISHDTQASLRFAQDRLPELTELRGRPLLALVDAIASSGAALTVGEWGAEREALCLEGLWGWERWARDAAHEVASNPWTMASAEPPRPGEPMAAELSELMALSRGHGRGAKRESMASQARGAYEARARAIGVAAQGGAPPAMANLSVERVEPGWSGSSQSEAWGSALADYERSSKNALRSVLAPPLWAMASLSARERPWGCQGAKIVEGGRGSR